MKIPRDLSGVALSQLLKKFDYKITGQTGSHMRLTTLLNGEHHLTIPNHSHLRIGTLSAILNEIALHLEKTKAELVSVLFG